MNKFLFIFAAQDSQTAKGTKPILRNVLAQQMKKDVAKSAMLVCYWSKDTLNYQLAQPDIGIMLQMLEVVLVLKVLSDRRNKKRLTLLIKQMKMILRKKLTRNISIEVKRSLQWSESEIHLSQCQAFSTCQDGPSKYYSS